MLRIVVPLLLACTALPATAQPSALDPRMDYDGYVELIQEVRPYRRARLLDWNAFAAAAREHNVLILDARSERQFVRGHIEGAVNLPLTEFSPESLAEVIGSTDRPILIYCNNNFINDVQPTMLKSGPVALNIPTFIHLYGYGYRNVRELDDVMDFNDPRVRWVRG